MLPKSHLEQCSMELSELISTPDFEDWSEQFRDSVVRRCFAKAFRSVVMPPGISSVEELHSITSLAEFGAR